MEEPTASKTKQMQRAIQSDDHYDEKEDEGDSGSFERESKKKEKAAVVVTGAMDAFTTTNAMKVSTDSNNHYKGRCRRKKVVAKTAVDANGNLHDENQKVLEDVKPQQATILNKREKLKQ
jgi:hypothetical protein